MSLVSHHHKTHKTHKVHHPSHNPNQKITLDVIHEQPVSSLSQNNKQKAKKKKKSNDVFLEIDPHWDEKTSSDGKWANKFFDSCDKSSDCSDAFFYPCIMNYLLGSGLGI